MKKLTTAIILLFIVLGISAQTYNGGTWYSYYNASGIKLNTIDSEELTGIFAPTAGTLNFNSSYNKLTANIFPKNKTYVYESNNGGSSSKEIGQALPDVDLALTYNNWGKEWNNSLKCSSNINWLKFDRATGNTHVNKIYNIKIPLAKHILLPSGTYGTTSATHDFGEVNALSVSEDVFHVDLRSFLTAGDITIRSSDPKACRINSTDNISGLTYAVGANACASANGKTEEAGGSNLGKISNYGFDIYFTPQEGKTYNETVTITDGTSTATISVSGTGIKLDQSISWDLEDNVTLKDTDVIAMAKASSDLAIVYTFAPEGVISINEEGLFAIDSLGMVTITAKQAGNNVYNAAQSVSKTITIIPAQTNYAYSASICQGDEYNDDNFTGLTEAKQYQKTLVNSYGTDSLITFTLSVNPTYSILEEKREIYVGTEEMWHGIDLSLLPLGDTTLVAEFTTLSGCDSIYTMDLSVVVRPTTYGEHNITLCAGSSEEYNGKEYTRPTTDEEVLIAEKNIYGGDSIVIVNVSVLPVKTIKEDSISIVEGTDSLWQEIQLSELPVGDSTLVASYTAANGCDSTFIVVVTVTEKINTAIENVEKVETSNIQKTIVNGNLFIRKGDALYDSKGTKVKSAK